MIGSIILCTEVSRQSAEWSLKEHSYFAFLELCFFRKNEQRCYINTKQSRVKAFSSNIQHAGALQESMEAQKRRNDATYLNLFILT